MARPACKRLARSAWSRWTGVQVASHVSSLYGIGCFAAVLQPEWLARGGAGTALLVVFYWAVFVLSLALYAFVCSADTRYRECSGGVARTSEYESRRCEECSPNITRLRVKHCQTCCKCTEDFDHHCRYLNVCVGGRTYPAWFCFVAGLFTLMAASGGAAVHALLQPDRHRLASLSSGLFYVAVGLQAGISCLSSMFLFSLLVQHMYFIVEGITTLEYVKDQAAGFPALPPRGWREAVRVGECYNCNEELESVELEDHTEVWFCTVCQADVGKAGVEFFTCDTCENVNVCPLCRDAARDPGAPVVTYRVASLRRRAEAQTDKGFREGSYGARLSSFSSQRGREPKVGRRTFSAVVAAVEGHSGDARRAAFCCGGPSRGRAWPGSNDAAEDDCEEGSGSSSDGTNGDI